jgi:magnesium transporter
MADTIDLAQTSEPWEEIRDLIDSGERDAVVAFMQLLSPSDVPYTISYLDERQRVRLLQMLPPEDAADLFDHLTDEFAADLIEDLPPETAAAIVDEMESDDQADIIAELDDADAHAILEKMDPEEAAVVRRLVQYPAESAGGLMVTEYLVFTDGQAVTDVIADLRANREKYADYDVQYVYVTNNHQRLAGVVRLRDILLGRGVKLTDLMIRDPAWVPATAMLEDLEYFFEHHTFNAAPVVDATGVLLGVVRREDVVEAVGERADRSMLRASGIITGEELRSMPLGSRALRRLAFLIPNILLTFVSISIIAMYESVIAQVTALAIFLPLVANTSGATGNQSVAVSIRELALGLVRPRDIGRLIAREAPLGVINGVVIGLLLMLLAYAVRPEVAWLGAVVGLAFALNSVLAICVGGALPLVLRRFRMDPAMVAGPVTQTVADMTSFFLVLFLAQHMLPALNT